MRRDRRLLRIGSILLSVVMTALAGQPGEAHAPDPTVGGSRWATDQQVRFAWKAGQAPPAWLAGAINGAAADSNATKSSRAPTFSYQAGAASLIAYGEPTGCSAAGIACFNRAGAPTSFRMWYRQHGYWFDWGQLRWCEAPGGSANGCYEARTIGLDEFGHVQILGHHVNHANQSDYLDAVVQAVSRAKPKVGWQVRSYGVCDQATLQLEYDVAGPASAYSSCLSLTTTLTLAASPTSVPLGGAVTFSASLKVATSTSYKQLGANPLSGKTVTIRRRVPGTTAWTTIATMAAGSSPGTYVVALTPGATYEWSATFGGVTGLRSSTSPTTIVSVSSCGSPPCPQVASNSE
jgi:hypothetical protein